MESFFTSGHAVDVILAFMVIEAVILTSMKRPVVAVLLTILPGAAMMFALRAAITGAPWPWIAFWLTVSLPLHIADLRHRPMI